MTSSSRLPVDAGDPPPIPAARSDSTGQQRRPLLVWVRTGTANVHIDGAVAFRLGAGDGAWIPADGWDHRAIITEPGTVAFPLWLRSSAGSSSAPTRLEIPAGWHDWLIQHYNLQVTPFRSDRRLQGEITDLLRRSRPASAPVRSASDSVVTPPTPPEMPRATGARAVAEQLVRDPALDLTVEEWAARALSSARTLRRDFLADTGHTFEQWRLHTRLIAALEFLAAGYRVDHVAAHVGFASRNGFARAFKQQYGLTPDDCRRRLAASRADIDPTPRVRLARQADDLELMVRGDGVLSAPPDRLPAASTPLHANDMHVLSWIYRGSGYLDIGDRRHERQRGVATWIPAGLEHVTGIREDSISLPLGNASTDDVRLTEPLHVRFPPEWDDYLMFCSLSARSILRPDGYDPALVLDLFAEQVAAQRALLVPMPTDPRARAAAMAWLRRIGDADESAVDDVDAEIQSAFREQTGMTLSRWRHAARMRIARDLLVGGARPGAVARRVGYAHLSTFSAAFTRFHGISARAFQEREAERA